MNASTTVLASVFDDDGPSSRGAKQEFEAFDSDDKSLGLFASQKAAAKNIMLK